MREKSSEVAGWPSFKVGFHCGLMMPFGQVTVRRRSVRFSANCSTETSARTTGDIP
jgi:hypothetical protein